MKKILFAVLSLVFLAACTRDNIAVQGTDVRDIDGNTYPTVKICNQTWTTKNLNVSKYRNGDVIPQVQDATQWANLKSGAWCYYENNTANGTIYGKLYNWYAVNDPRGLAPQGWRIPSDAEWIILTNCLGGESVAGGKMKTTGTQNWSSPNSGGSNSSGFSALPGGLINENGGYDGGKSSGVWWSSTLSVTSALGLQVSSFDEKTLRAVINPKVGLSVRCVKD
jgi:uncharacterized protein (TIGR02145 family)